ncbi:MAG: DUF1778 domain-containing protein [Actinomycetota bacterium]|nr:DUF1778 domain-containing protein [Actinomycetota bacterium]
MQLAHAISGLEAAVENQLRVAGPEASEIGAQLMSALQPAIRQTLMDVVAMAATEVSSQLPNQKVEVRLVDGDPELAVRTDGDTIPSPPPPTGADEDEARITIRLPGYLKELISEAASTEGDSVNTFVVDTLRSQAQTKEGGATKYRGTIEL